MEYAFDPECIGKWLAWMDLLALRFGYYYEPTPISTIDGPHNILDTDQDVFSTGLQFDFYSFQGRLLHNFECYFQYHHLRNRHVSNVNDDFFGSAELSGNVWSTGLTLTTQF